MNVKDYMKAKKLKEAANKTYKIKMSKKGDGKKYAESKPRKRKQRRTTKQASNRKS